MRPMLAALTIGLAALMSVACSGYSSHVASDDTALGRVVVYRNGIAFYERRATADGNTLTLTVPHDKVDDFLKSLTVTDAKTGETLPVSFPTRGAARDGKVDMAIQLPSGSSRELVLSYITEAPAWKPSYRIVVADDGKVRLQAWAIVDNTSGEDWKGVKVGVGSSSALSFRYDLRSVRMVHRETLTQHQKFAVAPPTGGTTHGNDDGTRVVGTLADGDIPRPDGHPQSITATLDVEEAQIALAQPAQEVRGSGGARGKRGDRGRRSAKQPMAKSQDVAAVRELQTRRKEAERKKRDADARIQAMARHLNNTKGQVILEGYAAAGEAGAKSQSGQRANVLRNQLIRAGVAPARIEVRAQGHVPGNQAGVKLLLDPTKAKEKSGGAAAAADHGAPIGESHFESKTAMSVTRGTSAMVSIVNDPARGEVVYLYDAEAKRGNKRYAFKAVKLKNPTKYTLESGPVTVYGSKRFIGEGLTEPIPPGATALVPFALDRQVIIDRKGSTGDKISRLLTVQRGVLTAEVQHTRKIALKITNRSHKTQAVYVRHTVRKGWELTAETPKAAEMLGEAHLFMVEVAAGKSHRLEIEEATPLTRVVDLRSPTGLDLVRVFLDTAPKDTRFMAEMRELVQLHTEIANQLQSIQSVRERMGEYRVRMTELQTQIASLKSVKQGSRLMRHLQVKMREISGRVQKATIQVVDIQEKLMMTRIAFQDRVSELTLERKQAAQAK